MSFRSYRKLLRLSFWLVEFDINVSSSWGCDKITGLKYKCMSKMHVFPKKTGFYKSLLTSKLICSKLCKKKVERNGPTFSYRFLWERVLLGYGYFLRLDFVGNGLRSVRKSESTCYPIIITSLPTTCYPTSKKKLYFFLTFLELA